MIPHQEDLQKSFKNCALIGTWSFKAEVERRLVEYGENRLQEKKKKTIVQRFFEQFKDVMIQF